MSLSKGIKEQIISYCMRDLPDNSWYENQFDFIKDKSLRKRLATEFKATRFAYKLYEGIQATEENMLFEIRHQIFAYASIYEAIIDYLLKEYYSDTNEFFELTHYNIDKNKTSKLRKKCFRRISFAKKCETAKKLRLIHAYNKNGIVVDFPEELIQIYRFRNSIHISAEERNNIKFELELSKKAYFRMKPFINQIKEQLKKDNKI